MSEVSKRERPLGYSVRAKHHLNRWGVCQGGVEWHNLEGGMTLTEEVQSRMRLLWLRRFVCRMLKHRAYITYCLPWWPDHKRMEMRQLEWQELGYRRESRYCPRCGEWLSTHEIRTG